MSDDGRVLSLIVVEIQRDGGVCGLSQLKGYNRAIERLMGDRRLLPLLEANAALFVLEAPQQRDSDVSHKLEGDWKVRLTAAGRAFSASLPPPAAAAVAEGGDVLCSYCGGGFPSRNRMFRHLQGGDECTEKAVLDGMKRPSASAERAGAVSAKRGSALELALREACTSALQRHARKQARRELAGGGEKETWCCLVWLTTTTAVTRALHMHTRMLPWPWTAAADLEAEEGAEKKKEEERPVAHSASWWEHATRYLCEFLLARPELFAVAEPNSERSVALSLAASRRLSSTQLKTVGARAVQAQGAGGATDAAAKELCEYIASILRKSTQTRARVGQGLAGVALGELGQFSDVQWLLKPCGGSLRDILQQHAREELLVYQDIKEASAADVGLVAEPEAAPEPAGENKVWFVRLLVSAEKATAPKRCQRAAVDAEAEAEQPSRGKREMSATEAQGAYRVLSRHCGGQVLLLDKPSGMTTERVIQAVQLREGAASGAGAEDVDGVGLGDGDGEDYLVQSVSRLDALTSGVLVMPLSAAAEEFLTASFAGHKDVRKTYLALVHGECPESGEVAAKLRVVSTLQTQKTFVSPSGKFAKTKFRTIERFSVGEFRYSLVEAEPVTGRTHQIRAHLAHIGHPLLRDSKYYENRNRGKKLFQASMDFEWCDRVFLHAARIELPGMGVEGDEGGDAAERVVGSAPLPAALEQQLQVLRGRSE